MVLRPGDDVAGEAQAGLVDPVTDVRIARPDVLGVGLVAVVNRVARGDVAPESGPGASLPFSFRGPPRVVGGSSGRRPTCAGCGTTAGVTRPGEVTVSIGTGEVVGGLTAAVIVDCGHLVETHAYPAGGYFVENPGWLSGGAVTWLKDLLGICSFEEFDALAATSPPGAEGVLFLPALTGATAPEWIAGARACFYGLTAAHGARHLARALLEGASFAMRDVIERLAELGISPMRLMLLSGGSRSRLAAQIRADVSGRSVALHKYADTSTIGAAMLAGVAAGTFKTVAEAASRAPTPAETLDPIPSASAVLDDSYWRYRELFQSLKPVFNAKG